MFHVEHGEVLFHAGVNHRPRSSEGGEATASPLRANERIYSPSNRRRRSSTTVKVAALTVPQQSMSRPWSIDRTASHRIALVKRNPPSGGATGTCSGTGRMRDVRGRTTTKPD